MPCDQLRYQYANFDKADFEVLRAAILRAGLTISREDKERKFIYFYDSNGLTGNFYGGKFTVQEGIEIDAIKRQYSNEAVERASKKYGFTVKKNTGNKYLLTRRTY